MNARQRLLLTLAGEDRTWHCEGPEWWGKCIHCGKRIRISQDGDLLGDCSIEHIVPRTQGGTEALENLALACRGCNSAKGCRQDLRGPGDPGYERMVALLRERRLARHRPLPPGLAARLARPENHSPG